MRTTRFALAAALLAALAAAPPGSAGTADNGTFRFLTQSLPDGSTNSEYVARILTANADGPVVFTISGLAPGLAYDPQSGFVTGRPTVVGNYQVDISAFDGATTIDQLNVGLKINASGGGGNEGATFDVGVLPAGKVGQAYAATLTVSNGVGPYTFGAVDLPPGVTLDGPTGVLSGSPLAAGTFFVSLSVYDAGEGNKVVKVAPMLVEPAGSTFQFATMFLNNGEVGTPYYDLYAVTGASGGVTFSASGFPAGMAVDANTGEVSGTPAVAGSFRVVLTATDSDETISTNLQFVVVPSSTSSLHWDFFGLPTAFLGVSYTRQPPVLVAAANNVGAMTYAAVGVPNGMAYNTATGELTGTPTDVGEYPILFTATDGTTGFVLTLTVDFVVLPPWGGDPSAITTNLWVAKQALKTGNPGRDSWKGTALWNADRRAGAVFDPLTDAVALQIGSMAYLADPAVLPWGGTAKNYGWASAPGAVPGLRVQVSPVKQTLKWKVQGDTIPETMPATLRHVTVLGGRGYRLDEAFSSRGLFKPALAYRRTAFVVAKGAIAAGNAGEDSVKLSLLLADPNFAYQSGVTPVGVRILDGAAVLYAKDLTTLVTGTTGTDRGTGATVHVLKGSKDPAMTDRLAKFSYGSAKGKMSLGLSDITLPGVPAGEAHLGIEITVGTRIYYTAVTFFETRTGKYTTTMP